MQRALRPSALVPPGFEVESAICDGTTTLITIRPASDMSLCPGCGAGSRRVHSRYQRALQICRWPVGGFGLWSRRGVSAAMQFCADDGSSRSASLTAS
jgi:hypothetical protein